MNIVYLQSTKYNNLREITIKNLPKLSSLSTDSVPAVV